MADLKQQDDVLALSWPVDIWDYLDWKDTLARPEHSERQNAYAARMGRRTPRSPLVTASASSPEPTYQSGFGNTFWEHLHHLFLPALTISILAAPIVTRNFRSTLIKELAADYVNAGSSKGLPESYIFWRHVFRNSLLPTVHLLGVVVSWLIGGTVVIETVFAVPGLGQLMVNSIFARDYYVVQGVTLLLALGVVLTNLIVDVVSMFIDPRIGE